MTLVVQLLRFGGVGLCGTAAHYATLVGLVEFVAWPALLASVSGYTVGAVVNYVLNARLTFPGPHRHRSALARYALAVGLGFVVNAAVVWFLHTSLSSHYLLAQCIATALVFAMNFALARYWVFALRLAS